MKSLFTHFLCLVFINSSAVSWAGTAHAAPSPSHNIRGQIEKAYLQHMLQFFIKAQNLSKKYDKADEYLRQLFLVEGHETPVAQKTDQLAGLKTPMVIMIKNGLFFEFNDKNKFEITLGKNWGEVLLDGKLVEPKDFVGLRQDEKSKSYAVRVLSSFEILPKAEAQAQVIMITAAVYAAFRAYIAYTLRSYAVGIAASATMGCGLHVINKADSERIDDACWDGGVEGAKFIFSSDYGFLIPFLLVNKPMSMAVSKSKEFLAMSKFLRGFGLLGVLGVMVYGTFEISKLSHPVLKCEAGGGYYVHARQAGAVGVELFGYDGTDLRFFSKIKNENNEYSVALNELAITAHLKKHPELRDLKNQDLKPTVEKILAEHARYKAICEARKGESFSQILAPSDRPADLNSKDKKSQ